MTQESTENLQEKPVTKGRPKKDGNQDVIDTLDARVYNLEQAVIRIAMMTGTKKVCAEYNIKLED